MDYEKRFKEVLERARIWQKHLYDTNDRDYADELNYIFPELKESEDEKIRKAILNCFIKCWGNCKDDVCGVHVEDAIAWIEKQGEQKPYGQRKECLDCQFNYAGECKGSCPIKEMHKKHASNTNHNWYVSKVDGKIYDLNYIPEPKFKVGDWITNKGHSYLIADIDYEQRRYLFEVGGYTHEQLNWEYIENADNKYHLWTIEDAKDGDVLIDKSHVGECVFIFKEARPSDIKTNVNNPLAIIGYCGINHIGFTSQLSGLGFGDTVNCIYYPATKEQRDLLFSKMKESGYEWDVEKKELKKIEQKPAEWNEEDERICQCLIEDQEEALNKVEVISNLKRMYEERIDWLKSLKQRIG